MCLSLVVAPLVHVVLGQEQMGGALLLWKMYTNLDVRQMSVHTIFIYSLVPRCGESLGTRLLYSHIENSIHLYIYTGKK